MCICKYTHVNICIHKYIQICYCSWSSCVEILTFDFSRFVLWCNRGGLGEFISASKEDDESISAPKEGPTGWRRPIGCLKLQVHFCKRATVYRALLRKMTLGEFISAPKEGPTGWRRPIRCLKLQFNFRRRASNSRALLWKISYKDKASCRSSPSCIQTSTQ